MMAENFSQFCETGTPYKLVDYTRHSKKGVIARSLKELINSARDRFSFPPDANLTVVLEQDGTEIDDEEYFATLDENTSLMILLENQKWIAAGFRQSNPDLIIDHIDHNETNYDAEKTQITKLCDAQMKSLIPTLQRHPSQISLLTGSELEMLSDMDPDSLIDIIYDRLFFTQIIEVSNRYLAEKRQGQEALSLLQIFTSSSAPNHSNK